MAYNRDKIYKQAVKAIEENNLYFIEDIVAYLPCSRSTFYLYYPDGSDELDTLKELLDDNKVKMKSKIRKTLSKSERASELLALYRLLATPEEHKKLNQSYVEQNTNVKIEPTQYTIVNDRDTESSS